MNAPGASLNQRHQPPTAPLPPKAAPAPPRPTWPGFSKNGVLSISLGMAANNTARHRPLFSVIPSFVLGFPTSPVRNQIRCRAASTSRIKGAPRKVFTFGAAQPPTPQLAQESLLVDLAKASGKAPQLHTTEQSPPESPPPKPSSKSPQPEQQGNPRELPSWAVEAVRQEDRVSFNWHKAAEAARQETAAHLEDNRRIEQPQDNQLMGWDTIKKKV